jgi:hypothetical protein
MSCAARYQETTSFEFILNPFKFFFTNYVKKSRDNEHWQASLVDAVSATYNLAPLATIDARIKAALQPDCSDACNVPQAPRTCRCSRIVQVFPHLLKRVLQALLPAPHCNGHCAASQASLGPLRGLPDTCRAIRSRIYPYAFTPTVRHVRYACSAATQRLAATLTAMTPACTTAALTTLTLKAA